MADWSVGRFDDFPKKLNQCCKSPATIMKFLSSMKTIGLIYILTVPRCRLRVFPHRKSHGGRTITNQK
jgi:hypothetical protein